MSAVTQYLVPRKRWSRKEAHALSAAGFFPGTRLELVEGELIDRMGKNPPHVLWKNLLHQWLTATFGGDYVRSEDPIDVSPEDMPTSEPEPDLIVTTRSIRECAENPQPEELRLVVEVADSTLGYDLNVKAALYARATIREYWVVNAIDKKIVVHREPLNGSYRLKTTSSADEEVIIEDARLRLDRL